MPRDNLTEVMQYFAHQHRLVETRDVNGRTMVAITERGLHLVGVLAALIKDIDFAEIETFRADFQAYAFSNGDAMLVENGD